MGSGPAVVCLWLRRAGQREPKYRCRRGRDPLPRPQHPRSRHVAAHARARLRHRPQSAQSPPVPAPVAGASESADVFRRTRLRGASGACYCRDIDREAQGATQSHPGAHPARRATQGAGRGEAPGNNSTTRERTARNPPASNPHTTLDTSIADQPKPRRRGRPGHPRRHDAPGKRKSVQTPHHRKRARQPHPTRGEQQRRSPTVQCTHDSTSEPEGFGQPNAAQARGRPPGNAVPPDNHEPALHPLDTHRTRPRAWTTRSPGGGSGSAPVRRHCAGCSDRPTDSDLSRHEDQHQRWPRTTHKGETHQ